MFWECYYVSARWDARENAAVKRVFFFFFKEKRIIYRAMKKPLIYVDENQYVCRADITPQLNDDLPIL